jgi:uncharacterized protein
MDGRNSERRESRRTFLRRGLWGAGGLLAGGGLMTLAGEGYRPRICRVSVPLPGLPRALHGFTICQLSDFHRGPIIPEAYLRGAAALANGLKPDLIALTGDYLSSRYQYAISCAAAIATLKAPYGVFGVLGNHDIAAGDPLFVSAAMEGAGVRVLRNGSARVTVNGADWWICGLDDVHCGSPSLEDTLAGVPERAFRILLCHEPDFADTAATYGIPLQLSGHSHGGQVVLPGRGPLIVPDLGEKYPQGLQRVEGSQSLVYTNVGLGMVAIPIRINCPPEITLLTLVLG